MGQQPGRRLEPGRPRPGGRCLPRSGIGGTLSEGRNQFILSTAEDGSWTLALEDSPLAEEREGLRRRLGKKVRVTGDVRIRVSGETLQLRDRTVRVRTVI